MSAEMFGGGAMRIGWVFIGAAVAAAMMLSSPLAAAEVAAPSDQVAAASASAAAPAAAPVAIEESAAMVPKKPKPRPKQRCQRIGFSVNDYGKDGPTADAKKGLDAYAARFAADKKIKSYKLGKKSVSCKLFLDFGLFDEYTCLAEANFCY